ncbi:MAG: tRNA pseudouridine(55) synthase TruB [Clostridia bacterium]|nr:tRNA pseudouridine(55) synthase TruB [Clostridia bacterium]
MNGFICVNKPAGMTSSDVVVRVRRRLPRGTSIGHGGTLDPEARGVLPLCVGKATRLFDYIVDKRKTYLAELQLGVETDTQDATGQVTATHAVDVDEKALISALPAFVGDIWQIPPIYSAVKRDGKRLYKLARKGETVALEPRKCQVFSITVDSRLSPDRFLLRVECGKGVYIRTLCHDIGRALGCGGMMASLERVSAGSFRLEDSVTPEELTDLIDAGELACVLIPMDAPLGHLPEVRVDQRAGHAVMNGNPLKPDWLKVKAQPGTPAVRIYLEDTFAGIGYAEADGTVRFRAMLLEREA